MQMIWSAITSDFDSNWRVYPSILMVVLGLRQPDLLMLTTVSHLKSRVHGLTLISRMIQLEDGALGQIVVSRMTDSDFSFYAL